MLLAVFRMVLLEEDDLDWVLCKVNKAHNGYSLHFPLRKKKKNVLFVCWNMEHGTFFNPQVGLEILCLFILFQAILVLA